MRKKQNLRYERAFIISESVLGLTVLLELGMVSRKEGQMFDKGLALARGGTS